MGIREWFTRRRERDSTAAATRAADGMGNESPEERELRTGDLEGLAADNRAARAAGQESMQDIDRPDR